MKVIHILAESDALPIPMERPREKNPSGDENTVKNQMPITPPGNGPATFAVKRSFSEVCRCSTAETALWICHS